jgi:hypothetical protein
MNTDYNVVSRIAEAIAAGIAPEKAARFAIWIKIEKLDSCTMARGIVRVMLQCTREAGCSFRKLSFSGMFENPA